MSLQYKYFIDKEITDRGIFYCDVEFTYMKTTFLKKLVFSRTNKESVEKHFCPNKSNSKTNNIIMVKIKPIIFLSDVQPYIYEQYLKNQK